MPEYTIKREDIMVMFKSLVSSTNQATNQANQDGDNSIVTRILKSYSRGTNAVPEKNCRYYWRKI